MSKHASNAKMVRVLLWDRCPESGWAAQFEQLLTVDSLRKAELRKFVGSADAISDVICDADVLVLSVPASETASACTMLQFLQKNQFVCPILILNDAVTEEQMFEFVKAGASDFLFLPLRKAEVLARLARWARAPSEVESAVAAITEKVGLAHIIGESALMCAQIEKLKHYARCDAPVSISGETGTGKEVFARALHYTGSRAGYPFLPVNCAALPVELVENELFGHECGAFTGARRTHRGLVEEAEGGTLFLDEIDSLPASAQAKLLRFLQEREYRPLGASRSRRANVRVISASNCDLRAAVAAGKFRQDLFFRLNVLVLHLPPLRERREDIPALAKQLLLRHGGDLGRRANGFSPAAMRRLEGFDWPGNVRELENVIERALVLSDAEILDDDSIDLPAPAPGVADESFKAQKIRVIVNFERSYLQQKMTRYDGNITQAAKSANKNRRAFFALLKKHQLTGITQLRGPSRG